MHSSVETKDSWAVAAVALIAMLMAFGGAWITPVALKDIAAESGGIRSVPALATAIAWLGNGFGGTVALAFAIAHPEKLSRLIISDAAASFPPEGREAFATMSSKVADGGLGSIAEIAARRVFSPAYLAAHPEKIEERKAVLMQVDPVGFQAACRILQETDLVPLLSHVRVPTLVICGSEDQATPPALNKQVADGIAGAIYVELPGCGHCPPLEQPQAFLDAVKEFVEL